MSDSDSISLPYSPRGSLMLKPNTGIMTAVGDLLESGDETCDVKFVLIFAESDKSANEHEIKCHKLILKLQSAVFDHMLFGPHSGQLQKDESGCTLVHINDSDPKIFKLLIRHIYSKPIDLDSPIDMLELYKLGVRYLVKGLPEAVMAMVLASGMTDAIELFYAYAVLTANSELKSSFLPVMRQQILQSGPSSDNSDSDGLKTPAPLKGSILKDNHSSPTDVQNDRLEYERNHDTHLNSICSQSTSQSHEGTSKSSSDFIISSAVQSNIRPRFDLGSRALGLALDGIKNNSKPPVIFKRNLAQPGKQDGDKVVEPIECARCDGDSDRCPPVVPSENEAKVGTKDAVQKPAKDVTKLEAEQKPVVKQRPRFDMGSRAIGLALEGIKSNPKVPERGSHPLAKKNAAPFHQEHGSRCYRNSKHPARCDVRCKTWADDIVISKAVDDATSSTEQRDTEHGAGKEMEIKEAGIISSTSFATNCSREPLKQVDSGTRTSFTLKIFDRVAGRVIGENGCCIKRMEKDSGANIFVKGTVYFSAHGERLREVTCEGTQLQLDKAAQLLSDCLGKYDRHESPPNGKEPSDMKISEQVVSVTREMRETLLMNRGRHINEIRRMSNAEIHITFADFPLVAAGKSVISIRGNQEQVDDAIYLMQKCIEKHCNL